jgi:hypothetical protein
VQLTLRHDLVFVTATLTYRGATISVPDLLVDTGVASTVINADIAADAGVFLEPRDRLRTLRGVGGRAYVFPLSDTRATRIPGCPSSRPRRTAPGALARMSFLINPATLLLNGYHWTACPLAIATPAVAHAEVALLGVRCDHGCATEARSDAVDRQLRGTYTHLDTINLTSDQD